MYIIRECQPKHRSMKTSQGRSRVKARAVKKPFTIKTLIYLYILYLSIIMIGGVIGKSLAVEIDHDRMATPTYAPIFQKVATRTLTTDVQEMSSATVNYSANYLSSAVEETVEEIDLIVEATTEPVVEEYNEPEPTPFHQDDFNGDSSVMCMSGLTAEQIEGMLENRPGLSGLGEAIYNAEQESGVDAFYTLAVASLESGYGTSKLATNKNNLFGLMGCSFESKEDCVAYFGRLMINYRDKHDITMTPNGINPRYCTTDTWASKVTQLMNQWAHKANELY